MTESDTTARVDTPDSSARTETAAGRSAAEKSVTPTRRRFLGAVGASVAAPQFVSKAAGARAQPTVSMATNYFDPVGLHVEPGTTVRFEVEDGSHSATAYDDRVPAGADTFDSGTLSGGGVEHTFETPGTYDYYCTPHRSMGMTGRIVVGGPGGPAEATPVPDGTVPDSESVVEQGGIRADDFAASGGDGHGKGLMGDGGAGSGMEMGSSHGLLALLPLGVVTAVLGFAGGALYWSSGREEEGHPETDDAIAILEHAYARGEIDESEFERRLERLQRRE